MSSRNTGLFVSGHLDPSRIGKVGEEEARVGHGTRKRKRYTHIGLASLEEAGSALFDSAEAPDNTDPVTALAQRLSSEKGSAVLLFCDDERGAGGHVRFENGEMVSRDIVDGRAYTPVRRDLSKETVLDKLDSSDWVWPLIAEALDEGAKAILGAGIRDDDDIEALIREAGSMREEHFAPPVSTSTPQTQVRGRADKVSRLLKRFQSKLRK